MRKIAAVIIGTLVAVLGPGLPAQGEGNRQGNWELFVDASGCAYDWQDQSWCGPALVVHAELYLDEEDRYSASMAMIGPNGDVPLQAGGSLRYNSGRGLMSTDPTYWGASFETRTPTGGLAPGRYGVTLKVNVAGRWSCSVYNKNGCSWYEGGEQTLVWIFDWAGQNTITPVIHRVDYAEGEASSRNRVDFEANVTPSPNDDPVRVTIQQKTKKGWKTVATRSSIGTGEMLFSVKGRPGTYRLFADQNPAFAVTVNVQSY